MIYFTENAPASFIIHTSLSEILSLPNMSKIYHVLFTLLCQQWTVDGVPGPPPEVGARSRVDAGQESKSGHARTLPQSAGVGTVPVPCMNLHHVYSRSAQVSNGV